MKVYRYPPADLVARFAGGDAQALIDWYEGGADGQIDWCSPGDFDACVAIAGEHLDNPEGFCQERHISVCGGPAGSEDKEGVRTATSFMREDGVMPKSRDQIIREFQALVAAGNANSYAARTAAATLHLGGRAPYWSNLPQDELDKLAKSGAAMPDGSYPITTCTGDNSVENAVGAVGRGSADHDAIRKHVMTRADSLGCASLIPDNWNKDGSLADDDGPSAARGQAMADAPAPPPDDAPTPPTAPAPPGTKSPGEAPVDAGVGAEVQSALDALNRALKAQQGDPGVKAGDPDDAKVLTGLENAIKIVETVVSDQADDSAEPSADDKPAPAKGATNPDGPEPGKDAGQQSPVAPNGNPPAAAGARGTAYATPPAPGGNTTPGNAQGVPGDADDSPPSAGDIEATTICMNPDCGHMASGHADTDDGENTGACQMNGCSCPGMVPEGQTVVDTDQTEDEPEDQPAPPPPGATPATPPPAVTAADPPPAPAAPPAPAPAAPGAGPTEPQAPPVQGAPAGPLPPLNPEPNATVGPEFTIPVGAIEGIPTGDGRTVDPGALTWRTPPLALMGLKTSSHDPSGMSGNDPAVLIGRIESIDREGEIISARGHMLATVHGVEFADMIGQMGRMGVSIDVGAAEVQITAEPGPIEGDVFDVPLMEHLTAGEIMGITVCPFPAFAGAYIVMGDGSNLPGVELPPPTPEQAAMAIRYVDAAPCEPCGDTALVASAAQGPSLLRPPSAWFSDPGFERGDERLVETIDPRTGRLSGKYACPITVTEDGQVFGHVAQWGVCHQSPSFLGNGQCVMAPRSRNDYAAFHGTGSVLTAEGELIGIGRMTADTGHASTSGGVSYAEAVAHYDNSGLTAAVVRAGEDEFGIWVAGALHPEATDNQVYTMRANPPSGDWRKWGVGTELCNVLFVNNPGFPMVRATQAPSTGRLAAVVAAGVPLFKMPTRPEPELTVDQRLSQIERGLGPVYGLARDRLRDRMASARRG